MLVTAGSTHDGEEEMLAGVFLDLKKEFPGVALLLAPRHPERVPQIEERLSGLGIEYNVRSRLPANSVKYRPVIILDTLGELVKYYSISDVVFVGKSLEHKGGQNPIEPAVLSKPVLFGPHMENFKETAELLLDQKGAVMIKGKRELADAIGQLLREDQERIAIGRRARRAIEGKSGALEITLKKIEGVLNAAV